MIDSILVALRIGFPFDLLIKATLVLGVASGVALVLFRSSAATRHLVWCVGVSGLLVLPVLALVVPAWEVPVPTTASISEFDSRLSTGGVAESPADDPAIDPSALVDDMGAEQPAAPAQNSDIVVRDNSSRTVDWMTVLFGVWAIGTLLLLVRLAAGWLGIRRLGRTAQRVSDPEWQQLLKDVRWMLDVDREVMLVRSDRASMPMTWGTRRPTILIPAEGDFWSVERRRVVLLHEMAHVARRDCLTQTVADVVCALYWFHPLAWIAARRLRSERERACDDQVLAAGERASDYAGHLLEVAARTGDRGHSVRPPSRWRGPHSSKDGYWLCSMVPAAEQHRESESSW